MCVCVCVGDDWMMYIVDIGYLCKYRAIIRNYCIWLDFLTTKCGICGPFALFMSWNWTPIAIRLGDKTFVLWRDRERTKKIVLYLSFIVVTTFRTNRCRRKTNTHSIGWCVECVWFYSFFDAKSNWPTEQDTKQLHFIPKNLNSIFGI